MASSFSVRSRSSASLRRSQVLFVAPTTQSRVDNGILTVRYEEALISKPPIAVTVPPPTHPPTDIHPAFRTDSSKNEEIERKRDSGLANVLSNRSEEGLFYDISSSPSIGILTKDIEKNLGVRIDFDVPSNDVGKTRVFSLDLPEKSECRQRTNNRSPNTEDKPSSRFSHTGANISTELWLGENILNRVYSTHRFPNMASGFKTVNDQTRIHGRLRSTIGSMSTDISDLSSDTEKESQNIRSMYELGLTNNDTEKRSFDEVPATTRQVSPYRTSRILIAAVRDRPPRSETRLSARHEFELAGGIEDWEDVDGRDVDRYGFITKVSGHSRSATPEITFPRRTSTILQLGSDSPRRRRGLNRISSVITPNRGLSIKSQNPRASSISYSGVAPNNSARASVNNFPMNRYRKLVGEAGDMLTHSHGLTSIYEDEDNIVKVLKKKEWYRAEKWRKMASIIKPELGDEGMKFDFDFKSAKLAKRTWKGIPDRWRAAAWYSFLRTSAKMRGNSPTELQIIQAFHKLLQQSSADDMQIDIDVPRTINSHIMFRKRYRGGQRLLFRVLHCLSLYFPQIGYVQGMASLAATLLCYYDEEKAFVMLVRLWTLRGMDKLYDPGFRGLMTTLHELQTRWVNDQAVSKKLDDLGIEPTAYGTRWYLTLFNYVIPFSAQLRVWDVFMLLGDSESIGSNPTNSAHGEFSILHAVSAALIDATRDILLQSDFENAMKTLASWIPIKDEELLMKVARAEWKLHCK